ncbi:MAG TPA: sensor domain-containing protein, partial [Glaciihabitans sp.]|nr:sensor domain-containing protein [Glaciihabitans sp.]
MSSPSAPRPLSDRSIVTYSELWRGVPRELGYLLPGFPLAVVGFTAAIILFSTGLSTLVTFVGIFLLIGVLYLARGLGMMELVRLGWAGRPPIERPEWQDARARQGFWGWLRGLFGNGHYWVYLLHAMVVNFVISLISWVITITWLSVGVAGVTLWIWLRFSSAAGTNDGSLARLLMESVGVSTAGMDLYVVDSIVGFAVGALFVATLPLVTRGLTLLHYLVARGMLGSFKSDGLQREVIALNASRGAAASAEGHSLRRLERDIHDGPQQRLVRLQMDLAAADRQIDTNPAKARVLIAEAMTQSKEALEELRALSRGFAPPILLDRGLVAALHSLAVRSPITTRVLAELPDGLDLPQEIERNAYFVASEALTNAAKHSHATDITVRVGLHRVLETDATWLDISVTDNGVGGATLSAGHGLAGLDERMRGSGGILSVTS